MFYELKSIQTFRSTYDLLTEAAPEWVEALPEEQLCTLQSVDDYGGNGYALLNGDTVVSLDSLDGEVIAVDTLEDFKKFTAAYLAEEEASA